jgi:hypothetical protein
MFFFLLTHVIKRIIKPPPCGVRKVQYLYPQPIVAIKTVFFNKMSSFRTRETDRGIIVLINAMSF